MSLAHYLLKASSMQHCGSRLRPYNGSKTVQQAILYRYGEGCCRRSPPPDTHTTVAGGFYSTAHANEWGIKYWGADKSLARPTSQCILFDAGNISFDASLAICMNSINIPPIMIIKGIYEHQNLLSLYLVSFLVGLRTYKHPCIIISSGVEDRKLGFTVSHGRVNPGASVRPGDLLLSVGARYLWNLSKKSCLKFRSGFYIFGKFSVPTQFS